MADTPTPMERWTRNYCRWCGAAPGENCVGLAVDMAPGRLVTVAPGGAVHACRLEDSTGAQLIATERQRQITAEHMTPDRDTAHVRGELVEAAMSYLSAALFIIATGRDDGDRYFRGHPPHSSSFRWPWHQNDWKPSWTDPVRMLTKAGALVAAEIDRLLTKRDSDARTDR